MRFHRSALVALACSLFALGARATVIEVEGPQDSLEGAPLINHCTLRKAIINANTDTAAYPQCAAGSGLDTIVFLSPMTISLTRAGINEEDALTGDLDITESVIITGNDGGTTIDGAALDRIFHVNPHGAAGVTVTLNNLNLINGRGLGGGGAILVNGATLNMNGVTISGSYAAEGDGGAVWSANSSTLNVTNCTISGNHARFHAGAMVMEGVANITNSTITGNVTDWTNLTGGLRALATVTLRNTIVAGNGHAGDDIPNLDGTFFSAGYNIIGDLGTRADNPTIAPMTGDQIGVTMAAINLGPLQNNGGPTPTHALLPGSIAIDKGHSSGSSTDQRGLVRPCDQAAIANASGGDGADVGAFEVQGACAVPNSDPVANDDLYGMNQDTTLNVAAPGVLGNDTDIDGDSLTAVLTANASAGNVVLNADGSFSYTPNAGFAGDDLFSYKANDGQADSNVVTVHIHIADTQPPDITAAVTTGLLWPPNHELVNVGFSLAVSDNGGGAVTTQLDVLSDEDDVTGGGGEMSPDAKSVAATTLRLRSERDGTSDGRVYVIRIRATDTSSNTAVSCVTVVVPKSMSAGDLASVNAQASAAHASCTAAFVVGDGPKVGPKQ